MNKQQEIDSIEKEIKQLNEIIDKRKQRLEELNTETDETILPLPSNPTRISGCTNHGLVEKLSEEQ